MKIEYILQTIFIIAFLNRADGRNTILCFGHRVEVKCLKNFVLRIDFVFHGYDPREKVVCSAQPKENKELRLRDHSAKEYVLEMCRMKETCALEYKKKTFSNTEYPPYTYIMVFYTCIPGYVETTIPTTFKTTKFVNLKTTANMSSQEFNNVSGSPSLFTTEEDNRSTKIRPISSQTTAEADESKPTTPLSATKNTSEKLSTVKTTDTPTTKHHITVKESYTECLSIRSHDLFWGGVNVSLSEKFKIIKAICPDKKNQAERLCVYNEGWKNPNTSKCISPATSRLLDQLKKENIQADEAALEITKQTDNVQYAGDIEVLSEILERISSDVQDSSNQSIVEQITIAVTQSVSNLLDEDKKNTWMELSKNMKNQIASNLMLSVENSAMKRGKFVDQSKKINPIVTVNLEINIVQKNSFIEEYKFFPSTLKDDSINSKDINEIIVPRKAIPVASIQDDTFPIVFTEYSNVESYLSPSSGERDASKIFVNSKVIGAALPKNSSKDSTSLESDIFYIMQNKNTSESGKMLCSFWNYSTSNSGGSWSEYGCYQDHKSSNKTHTKCRCNHLTNFAVLLDISDVDSKLSETHRLNLMIITYVGCSISIVCLFLSFVCFVAFRRNLSKPSLGSTTNLIRINLTFTIMIAQLIFLTGISRTNDQVPCIIMGGLLFYFLLSSFTWMGLQGVAMYIVAVSVFDTTSSCLKYIFLLIGYGFPIVIIGVTAGFDHTAFKSDKYCWLNDRMIWAFIVPVLTVIIINFVMLFIVLSKIYGVSKGSNTKRVDDKVQKKRYLSMGKATISLLFVFGLGWVFGFLYISRDFVWAAYVFTALNSCQGAGIFIFHCAMEKTIQDSFRNWLRRQEWISQEGILQQHSKKFLLPSNITERNSTSVQASGDGYLSPEMCNSCKKDPGNIHNCLSCSQDTLDISSVSDHKITPISSSELDLNKTCDPIYEKMPDTSQEDSFIESEIEENIIDVNKYILLDKTTLQESNIGCPAKSNEFDNVKSGQNDLNKTQVNPSLNVSLRNMNYSNSHNTMESTPANLTVGSNSSVDSKIKFS
ncbi:DgyrCDS1062 [Dimorphilus gyrociliatus]|uniref:DgyrCDS1062 n=1 Tax=Dimorphilus gyrociliatus TaxID=2664684 RepID=A0A7I8VB79_9ANNE|nr:DgyrCDS1062 [Dimorphilus gyrociliatus]